MPTPAELLRYYEVDQHPGVFVLGCYARRLTFYTQQVRALNLVYCLIHEDRLPRDGNLAVVGGGASGMTAAAAALCLGYRVTLFEKLQSLLPLQQGNDTRWLHPRIYDWPAPGSEHSSADLPLLSWQAGSAGEVADQVLQSWGRIAKYHAQNLTVHHGADVKTCAGDLTVSWRHAGAECTEKFAGIVVAVGFGVEPNTGNTRSYWHNDELAQPHFGAGRRTYLVSGCGDGGLIDCLRLKIARFRQDRLIRDFFSDETAIRTLAEIHRAERSRDLPDYRGSGFNGIDDAIRERLREDTDVTLMSPPPPLGGAWAPRTSSPLHRFLVQRLIALGEVEYVSHRLDLQTVRAEFGDNHARTGTRIDGVEGLGRYDELIVRHNVPDPPVQQFEAQFPGIVRLRDAYTINDPTRTIQYGRRFASLLRRTSMSPAGQPVDAAELRGGADVPSWPSGTTSVIMGPRQGVLHLVDAVSACGNGDTIYHASLSKPLSQQVRAHVTDQFTPALVAAARHGVVYRYVGNLDDDSRRQRVLGLLSMSDLPRDRIVVHSLRPDDVRGLNFFVINDNLSPQVVLIPETTGQDAFIIIKSSEAVAAFISHFELLQRRCTEIPGPEALRH